ncbi:hypothetical protein DN752_08880 [Echinicola strongylocentroti]|uniref:Uncharacterized protein n=1 Tax=Echinicola strongylocentroti TaxID=1795355 RepID=A0A2Z4II84_9BACT|nr:hypothetical protein [Echinicola strongylocentroti]AWW30228.1 hypothetical protein DN752_08880 [Echinicola strongylocentroti]
MRNLYIIVTLAVAIASCDPVTFISYKIENSSNEELSIYFYSSINEVQDTLVLKAKSTEFWQDVSVGADTPEKIDLNQYYDSIKVESANRVIINYTPETTGKTIYDYSYWSEHKKGKRNYEYVYEITEEDLASGAGQ